MKSNALLGPVLGVLLAVMVGWLLWIGRGLLVPIVSAAIAVYVLGAATDRLRRLPLIGRLPDLTLRLLALLFFAVVLVLLGVVVAVTVRQLIANAPAYQANFEAVAIRMAAAWGAEGIPTWVEIRAATMGQINVQALLTSLLGGVSSTGATIALVVVYAAFLFGERASFAAKLAAAFDNPEHVARTAETLGTINSLVGDYLAAKTLANVVLGVLSYLILLFFGVDFALFFALVIGLSNYIPYVGTFVGIVFPILLSLAQFGSISLSLSLAALLSLAQFYVGFILEPRFIGRQVDLSPFTVMVALSLWSALWGLPGAILAIPLTSVLAIILQQFAATRPIAVMLSNGPRRGGEAEPGAAR